LELEQGKPIRHSKLTFQDKQKQSAKEISDLKQQLRDLQNQVRISFITISHDRNKRSWKQ